MRRVEIRMSVYSTWRVWRDTYYHQKQPPEVLCKKRFLKNFTTFTGKHLCQSLFLMLQGFNYAMFLKRESNVDVFMWSLRIFLNTYFEEHLPTTASLSFFSSSILNVRTKFWRCVLNVRQLMKNNRKMEGTY